ncbi:hypothetical protein AXX17_AT1G40120 [Arabidopsis thaliana]|uniref:Uncharacterized protein n=1 Tax=Arabidopsis thaliana TaxID=3702 RepID=A0A178W6E5_ARATH|nr:hypothetical protein AXX17_AT1G40120 [Arabidopsis thaliana]
MNSVGVFRKEEIDGKSFLVYTLTQTDNPTSSGEALAMDSGGDDLPLQPLFFCPAARINFHKLKLKIHNHDDDDDAEDDDNGDDKEDGDDDNKGDDGDDDNEDDNEDDDNDDDDDDDDENCKVEENERGGKGV